LGSGLFLSELILSTLALHFIATNTLDNDIRSTDNPEGALLLAVVAVSSVICLFMSSNKVLDRANVP
jgi:uncharacterized membrane protein